MTSALRCLAAIAASGLMPGTAVAHSFKTGNAYPEFTQGIGAALNDPVVLLTLIPVGIMAGLWRRGGMTVLWPWLIGGIVAGLLAAPLAGPAVAVPSLVAGILAAILGLTAHRLPAFAPPLAAALTGLLAGMFVLEGHELGELPLAVYAGVFFGMNLIAALPAMLADGVMARWPYPWARIGVMIAASWSAAIAVIFLAFQFR